MSTLAEFPLSTVAEHMQLPAGQRLVRVSVDDDPQRVWFYIEGGDELADEWFVPGCETPIRKRGPEWPMPAAEQSGARHQVKTWAETPAIFPGHEVERVFVREGLVQLLCFVFAGDPPPRPAPKLATR